MFQRVLIPLDGSALAEQVLAHVGQFVLPTTTELVLVRVLETMRYPPSRYGPVPMDLFDSVRRQYASYLEEMSIQPQAAQYRVVTVVAEGDAATEILKTAQNCGADLIAMTTRGRSGLKRWALGSVAEHVLEGASLPVLLVREQPGGAHNRLQRIMVPLDGSALAEQVLPYAQWLAQTTGAKLLLLQVVDDPEVEFSNAQWPPSATSSSPHEHGVALAQEYLQAVCDRLQAVGLTCHYKVLGGIPHQSICQIAQRRRIDMVVMSTHGNSDLRRWLFGSVANHVIRGVSCPVLVVRELPT
ncbi:MAG: universal stress protein [Caldilineaceae bacterium]|nr:universal stress protein [Caldilineaceae bacterium]